MLEEGGRFQQGLLQRIIRELKEQRTREVEEMKLISRMMGIALVAALFVSVPSTRAGATVEKDIVDTAVAAGSFKTLATALQSAGLVETLKGKGPFTVFAPTDEAFAKLPAGTVEGLLKDKAKLKKILLYHVVPGNVTAKDVVKLNSAKTPEGSSVAIKVVNGKVKVDNATVVKADVGASNGVIHVIDTVILPK